MGRGHLNNRPIRHQRDINKPGDFVGVVNQPNLGFVKARLNRDIEPTHNYSKNNAHTRSWVKVEAFIQLVDSISQDIF